MSLQPGDVYAPEDAADDVADLRAAVDGMNEAHSLGTTTTDVPNTDPSAATLYGESTGVPAYVTDSGLQMNIPGAQYAFFPSHTVTGTGLTNMAQGTYTGGDAGVGSMYELEVWGNGVWDGTTRQTLQFQVVWGGTNTPAVVNLGTTWFSVSANMIFRWRATVRVICLTTGSSGTWQSFLDGVVSTFSAAGSPTNMLPGSGTTQDTGPFFACESGGTTTKDSTVSQSLGLSCQWGGAATNGQSITSQVAFFKKLA